MFTQEVNVDAMYRATTLLFGADAAMMLAKIADVIDDAQKAAYDLGKADGEENFDNATRAAFDAGWVFGEAEGQLLGEVEVNEVGAEAYDDGYLQGVQDARAHPALADEVVQDIINERAEDHFEALDEYDADNVQDSGDETLSVVDGITYRTYAG